MRSSTLPLLGIAALASMFLTATPAMAVPQNSVSVSANRGDFSFPGGNMTFKINYSCADTEPVHIVVNVTTKRGSTASANYVADALSCSANSTGAFVAAPYGQGNFEAGSRIEFVSRLSRHSDHAALATNNQQICPAGTWAECPQG